MKGNEWTDAGTWRSRREEERGWDGDGEEESESETEGAMSQGLLLGARRARAPITAAAPALSSLQRRTSRASVVVSLQVSAPSRPRPAPSTPSPRVRPGCVCRPDALEARSAIAKPRGPSRSSTPHPRVSP